MYRDVHTRGAEPYSTGKQDTVPWRELKCPLISRSLEVLINPRSLEAFLWGSELRRTQTGRMGQKKVGSQMLAAVGGYTHLHTVGARDEEGMGGPAQMSEFASLHGEMNP